jgi:arginine decarboxylase
MRTKYIDLISQTYEFPQEEFKVEDDELIYNDIPLMDIIKQYGTPLKITYLPRITQNIQRARRWFNVAIARADYRGDYHYCYCTKSSHFEFVLTEVLKNGVHIETSSAFDLNLIEVLHENGQFKKDNYIICNGFKKQQYIDNIAQLITNGFTNVIPILDNMAELDQLNRAVEEGCQIGIRIAAEEEPRFEFYTSRLGIRYNDILNFYESKIKQNPKFKLKMLHFFINTGINDTAYYWNELTKCLQIYAELKKVCPTLDSLNIGGGFPIKKSLAFEYDYAYMVQEILLQIKTVCEENHIPEPHIFTEFGSFTVGESGGALFKVLHQKQQNDREKWNMIDSSFMTNLPDTWAINQRFIMLPVNRWESKYERVLLGGLTCDSDDYYNSEQHSNAIYLPQFDPNNELYIGFFNTGAYQETIGGFGGLKHCLIPEPKHIIISRNEEGRLETRVFSDEQNASDFMNLLGYYR